MLIGHIAYECLGGRGLGATVSNHDWRSLLETWCRELLEEPEISDALPPEVRASGWLGYAPVSQGDIADAERRLGVALPPSYRSFLGVTDGWRNTGYFIEDVWHVAAIDWYANRHQDLIDAWIDGEKYAGPPPAVTDDEYLDYGPNQQAHTLRSEYLNDVLQISDIGDGVYLLNPRIVTPDGEWEAWFFADWLPGATRYPSFWDLMNGEHQSFLQMRAERAR